MKQEVVKNNILFILLIGIEGLAFGLIDWSGIVSDILYVQYNNKILISIIGASIAIAKFLATLICIYLSNSKKSNKIFIVCQFLCAFATLAFGIFYKMQWIILFAFFYVLESLIMEVYSGYHYAYVHNSLPEDIAVEVHSKRICIFKMTFMLGLAIAGFWTTRNIENTIIFSAILAFFTFTTLIYFTKNVKGEPKEKAVDTVKLKDKLDLQNYTKYYKSWLLTKFLGKFALSSLVVVLSMMAIDKNFELTYLKLFKTISWTLSAIGFGMSAYLIKNNKIVQGDIICKVLIVILVGMSLFNPYCIYLIFLLNGVLNPFNTMSNFKMIQMDKDNISIAQKELVINLAGYFAAILASYILVNIHIYFALCIICISLIINVASEVKLYKYNNLKSIYN